MTVQTTFAANISAADARDTLNAMLADIVTLKGGGSVTPPPGQYGPSNVADTGVYDTTKTSHRAQFTFAPGKLVARFYMGLSADGLNSPFVVFQKTDDFIAVRKLVNGTLGAELNGTQRGTTLATGDTLGVRLNANKTVSLLINGTETVQWEAAFIGSDAVGTCARIEAFDGGDRTMTAATIVGL